MTTKYDEAVISLYRVPLETFVAERKRLVSELKAAGDKAGATRLTALARPPISAWTVNQLWWEARETFDELFAAAARLRQGDLGATNAHRDAMTKLRARAEALLGAAGHAAVEATLRRIMTDLSALAAAGNFDPDPPGALAGDREPVGFDVAEPAKAPASNEPDGLRREGERLEEERRKAEEERRRKAEEERARKRAERTRLEVAVGSAKGELDARMRDAERLRGELAEVEKTITRTRANIADLESRLVGLD